MAAPDVIHYLDTWDAEQLAQEWAQRHGYVLVQGRIFSRIVEHSDLEVVARDADGTPTTLREVKTED